MKEQIERVIKIFDRYLVRVNVTAEQDPDQHDVVFTFESVLEYDTVSTTRHIYAKAIYDLPDAAFIHLAKDVASQLGRELFLSYSYTVDSKKVMR